MNEELFSFEQAPWELALEKLRRGQAISALRFLTLVEGEDEFAVEDALQMMEDRGITLDISDLPKAEPEGQAALRLRQEQQLAASGDLLTGLEETDPLRLYLEELASIPAAGDVNMLALCYAQGDESVRQQLVNLSLSRCVEQAREYTGRGVLLLDLIQEGSLGLWQGILCYTGGDFEPHILWWIRQYMAKAVALQARQSGVGARLRRSMEEYRRCDRELLTKLGRNPTLEEISLAMQISVEEGALIQQMLLSAKTVEQAKAPRENDLQEEAQAVEDTAYFQSRQRILELLSQLSQEEAQILTLRFGLEGGLPETPQQVGAKLGLTAQEVTKKEAAALSRLRNNR